MPHLRGRHLTELYLKTLSFSPIVGIFGHRQVGKTTFLAQNVARYLTFDQADVLESAREDAHAFVSRRGKIPLGIDEAQLAPELFPALKEHVRTRKKVGQFVLSGSVRFSSRKAIRESLTGRIMTLDLLPMTLTELDRLPLAQSAKLLFGQKDLVKFADQVHVDSGTFRRRGRSIDQYLECGGLPGACFIRDPRFRADRLREQLQTILDRDIRLVYPTTLTFREVEDYVRILAAQDGEILHLSRLRKRARLAEATQKKLLQCLEAVFLIRLFPVEGDRKGLVAVFEDQAEAGYLSQGGLPRETQLANLIYRNIRAQFAYLPGENVSYFQYRTRAGAVVPFALRSSQGELGFIACSEGKPSRRELFAAQSFIRRYGAGRCILATFGSSEVRASGPRILQLPAEWLLFE